MPTDPSGNWAPERRITQEEATAGVLVRGWDKIKLRWRHSTEDHEHTAGYFVWSVTQEDGRFVRYLDACGFCGLDVTRYGHPDYHGRWHARDIEFGFAQSTTRHAGEKP